MNGVGPKVSVVLVSNRTDDALRAAVASVTEQDYRPIEIVLHGNGAPIDLEVSPAPGLTVRRGASERNLGVAGGRNAAAALAGGEALMFLDDDAILRPGALRRAVEALESASEVGAVALRVIDPVTGRTALWYQPGDADVRGAEAFDASSFIGCGNLVRRSCFDRLNGFWDGYFREMEEIDFSWRLVDLGLRIRYEPEAVVEHPERSKRHLRHSAASNLLLVWRLLPAPLALRQTCCKLVIFVLRALRHGELGELGRGMADALRGARRLRSERSPLSPATVLYLRRVHAPQGLGKRLQWSLRSLEAPAPTAVAASSTGAPGRPA